MPIPNDAVEKLKTYPALDLFASIHVLDLVEDLTLKDDEFFQGRQMILDELKSRPADELIAATLELMDMLDE